MIIAACQHDIVWEDKHATQERVRALLDAHHLPRGSLLVLPEMFATGFSMNVEKIAEGEQRVTERFLSTLARENAWFVLAGVVTRGNDGSGRNEAVLFDPAGVAKARYVKLHPFSAGGESAHYVAGEEIVTVSVGEFTMSPFVCYDLRFPEVFRSAVKRGAQLFIVIANWPQARAEHWSALLKARAIENQAFVVGVNRCGADPNHSYAGRSLILGPRGEVLAETGDQPAVIRAEIGLGDLLGYRAEFPALRDMRVL
jgi:omega-amidase